MAGIFEYILVWEPKVNLLRLSGGHYSQACSFHLTICKKFKNN